MNFRSIASPLLALFVLALSAPDTLAQGEPKEVYSPELAGGTVYVEGLLFVHFYGDERSPIRPQVLTTTWKTYAAKKIRRVIVTEERFLGQPEGEWKAEHLYLVAKVAGTFPMLSSPATWTSGDAPELTPTGALVPPKRSVRFPRRVAAIDTTATPDFERSVLQPFDLPQPFTLSPRPRLHLPRVG